MVSIHFTSSKVSFVFFKSLEVHSNCMSRTTKVLKVVVLDRADIHKEKSEQQMLISGIL
jgi:hypothetical protein